MISCFNPNLKNQSEILTKEENEQFQKQKKQELEQQMRKQAEKDLNSKLFKEAEMSEWKCIQKLTGLFVNPKHTNSKSKIQMEQNNIKKENKSQQQKEIDQEIKNLEKEDQIKILNPIIQLKDNSFQWIHTYECGFEHEEIIVLIHGYAGCAMTYVMALEELSKKFHVFAIDMIGFGMSSRPKFNLTDPQEIIDYMIESLELWRQQMIPDNKKIYLCGHSYGGYISSMYAIKYHQNLKSLILLSPIGTTEYTEEQVQEREKTMVKNFGFTKKLFFDKLRTSYKERSGPTRWLNKFYIPTNYLIERYFSKRLGLPKEEVEVWSKFMANQFKFNESTEKGFFDLFLFPNLAAKYPLKKELLKLQGKNIQVHFMYGQFDWMDPKGAKQLYEEQKIECTYTIVDGAGHQIVFEQPFEMAKKINQIAFPDTINTLYKQNQSGDLVNEKVKGNIKNKDQKKLPLAKFIN